MSRRNPPALERLLRADDGTALDGAWSEFLEEYSRLILHGARSFGGSNDAVMDRYAYVLEQLRRDDFRRLRRYASDGRGKFTTWLVVVVRRLCLDQERARYGRPRGGSPEQHRQRRDLADLIGVEVDPELLPAPTSSPEDDAVRGELHAELRGAVASLDPSERLLLRLRFQDEVPASEIARIYSLPNVFHVYRRLNRICDRLRQALLEAGVSDPAP
jgi:RNA polymerase sigma factor (sigma-70 family)